MSRCSRLAYCIQPLGPEIESRCQALHEGSPTASMPQRPMRSHWHLDTSASNSARSGSAPRGSPQDQRSPQDHEDLGDKSAASSADMGPTSSKVPVPRFLSDRSGTDSDSESVSHGQGGGYMSRALSILSNEYDYRDYASLDSPLSPRQSAADSSSQRGHTEREREDSKISACNAALHDLISHLQTLRSDDTSSERAAGRHLAERMPQHLPQRTLSWDGEMSSLLPSMSANSTMDFSAHFSGNLLSSTPGSPAVMSTMSTMSMLGTSPSSRSGLEAASGSLLRSRGSSSMNPLRNHGGGAVGNHAALHGAFRRGSSPLIVSRNSPSHLQRCRSGRSWVTPEASPRGVKDGEDTSRGSGGSSVSLNTRRGRDMASIGMTSEDRIHQLQQLRLSPEHRSSTPPLVPQLVPAVPSSSTDDAPEDRTRSSPLGTPSVPGHTHTHTPHAACYARGGEAEKKLASPPAGSLASPSAAPLLSLGSASRSTSCASSPSMSGSRAPQTADGTKLDLGRTESNSPAMGGLHKLESARLESGALQRLDLGRGEGGTECSSPASGMSADDAAAERESPFRRSATSSSREERRRAASSSRDSKEAAGRGGGALSPCGQGRFEMLPETRRRSIEVRARSSLDLPRRDHDTHGLVASEAGAAAKKPTHLTSEQQTELVALEILQDVASSSVLADTARQLEYLLDSLEPVSETALTMRAMDVVEALGTIIQRKLNVLRDMESVTCPDPSCPHPSCPDPCSHPL